jgi:methionine synthase II (cobalamin-independent)
MGGSGNVASQLVSTQSEAEIKQMISTPEFERETMRQYFLWLMSDTRI